MLWLKWKSKYFKLVVFVVVFIERHSVSFKYFDIHPIFGICYSNTFKFTLKIRFDVELVDILEEKLWIFCLLRVSQYIFRFFVKQFWISILKMGSFVAQTELNFHSFTLISFLLSVLPEICMVLDSFLRAFVVGFCDVKHATEELHRDTLRLPRSCWNSLVQWILRGFFLLSVYCMTSACFSFPLFFQVDTEFCPNSSQLEYQLLSLSCVTTAHSSSWDVWEKIHCSFWTAQN